MMNKGIFAVTVLLCAVSFYLGSTYARIFSEDNTPLNQLERDLQSEEETKFKSNGHASSSIVSEQSQDLTEQNNRKYEREQNDIEDQDTNQIKALRQSLSDTISKLQKSQAQYSVAKKTLQEAGLEEPASLSQEDADKILPSPFSNIISSADPDTIERFKDFHAQEEDYDWALQIGTKIEDFFALHELANKVQVVQVTCKTDSCEVYGYQDDGAALTKILQDLHAQDWFTSIQTRSMSGDSPFAFNQESGDDSENGDSENNDSEKNSNTRGYFYLMFSMLREPS